MRLMNSWFSVTGELEPDGRKWYPRVFRTLRHRIGPDAPEVTIDGRVFLFSLCGSPVVKKEAPPHSKMCSKCKQYP
ncbi:hypothetical protein BJ970_002629 [Saccharopolyspora phatthalungensis]|uniref:Uncharacterized protein n=1 Tax=Saccharopolyspora phatthalungensis TaxID=664693 RepID=A0A840Q9G9_9PSEU|nr:hypothetical protein [Saccharopolyspora phatthalungensis]